MNYDVKILDLIKSTDSSARELAVSLLQSQHGFKEDAAKALVDFSIPEMLGETFIKVEQGTQDNNDCIRFYLSESHGYIFYHDQDCCEMVYVEDINGDLDDLVGAPMMQAEETVETGGDTGFTYTFTFYKFATRKGYVTIRWEGSSNGYYSESVYFGKFGKF